jgi:hypothetical protein
MVKLMNPFRKRTGIFPSYFTGREDELNELREIYESTREGAAGHIIIYGPKGTTIRPRSKILKRRAGTDVAALSASIGVSPALTSN